MKVLFLPGAGGSPDFWKPVGERLPNTWTKVYFGWPGLGDQPPDPAVQGFDDLVDLVMEELDEPADLVAQSMGGVVAVRTALRSPERIRRLVLVGTSGGIDVTRFGSVEWREDYRRDHPQAAEWILQERPNHTAELGRVRAPTLLVWGEEDAISPVSVAKHLLSLLPNVTLRIVEGGSHTVAFDCAEEVASLITNHLKKGLGDN